MGRGRRTNTKPAQSYRTGTVDQLFEAFLAGDLTNQAHLLINRFHTSNVPLNNIVVAIRNGFKSSFLIEVVRRLDALPEETQRAVGWAIPQSYSSELRAACAVMVLGCALEVDLLKRLIALPGKELDLVGLSFHRFLPNDMPFKRMCLAWNVIRDVLLYAERLNRLTLSQRLTPVNLYGADYGLAYYFWAHHPLGGARNGGIAAIDAEDPLSTALALKEAAGVSKERKGAKLAMPRGKKPPQQRAASSELFQLPDRGNSNRRPTEEADISVSQVRNVAFLRDHGLLAPRRSTETSQRRASTKDTLVPNLSRVETRDIAAPFVFDARTPKTAFFDALGLRPRMVDAATLEQSGETALRELYEQLPRITLFGGPDIPQQWYDASVTTQESTARDRVEVRFARWALEHGKPLVGICRGMQLLNVIAGGSLHVDLHTAYPNANRWLHRRGEHLVRIDPMSRLAQRLGLPTSDVPTDPETWPTIIAPSSHHQCIRAVADGFRVVAFSSDGIVEAIEHLEFPDRYWGVQFHPERNLTDARLRRLTEEFLIGENSADKASEDSEATHS